MAPTDSALREAVGRTLRRLRLREGLSLEEVDRGTRDGGIRVTRSHLSRVENGRAELTLTRFLSLARVLGTSPEEALRPVAEALASAREGHSVPARPEPGLPPHHEARRWRLLAAVAPGALSDGDRLAWADAEGRLGRWDAAARILEEVDAEGRAGIRVLGMLACAQVGAGRPALARALAAALPPRVRRVVTGLVAAAGERPGPLSFAPARLGDPAEETLCRVLAASVHLAGGRLGAALRAATGARNAAIRSRRPVLRAEASRMVARVRAAAGDREGAAAAFREAAREARRGVEPALLLAVHREAAREAGRARNRDASRAAHSAARALVARCGLPPGPGVSAPVRGAWCWIAGDGPTGPAVSERSPEAPAGAAGGTAG